MGLMLSLLVVCVGVIEALSCYEHFQFGVLDCATNIYETARRRSSVFLNYTSRRLKLLSDNSIAENDTESRYLDQIFESPQENFNTFPKKPKKKKLEKEEKIEIVKRLLEKPSTRPRAARSISMPEFVYTEEDLELSKIINELANEPIEEANVEIEETDLEIVTKEFDKLFDNFDNETSSIEPEIETEEVLEVLETAAPCFETVKSEKPQNHEPGDRSEEETDTTKESAARIYCKNYFNDLVQKAEKTTRLNRSTSIDYQKISLLLSKSEEKVPTKKRSNLPSENPIEETPQPVVSDASIPSDKLINIIFENNTPTDAVDMIDETFERIYNDVSGENSDVTTEFQNEWKEIEKMVIEALDEDTVANLSQEYITSEIAKYMEATKPGFDEHNIDSENKLGEAFVKTVNKFADELVAVCLEEIRKINFKNYGDAKEIKNKEVDDVITQLVTSEIELQKKDNIIKNDDREEFQEVVNEEKLPETLGRSEFPDQTNTVVIEDGPSVREIFSIAQEVDGIELSDDSTSTGSTATFIPCDDTRAEINTEDKNMTFTITSKPEDLKKPPELLALEYKTNKTNPPEESKTEVIPLECGLEASEGEPMKKVLAKPQNIPNGGINEFELIPADQINEKDQNSPESSVKTVKKELLQENQNTQPLAIKGETLLALDFKSKRAVTEPKETIVKDSIPLEWKQEETNTMIQTPVIEAEAKENIEPILNNYKTQEVLCLEYKPQCETSNDAPELNIVDDVQQSNEIAIAAKFGEVKTGMEKSEKDSVQEECIKKEVKLSEASINSELSEAKPVINEKADKVEQETLPDTLQPQVESEITDKGQQAKDKVIVAKPDETKAEVAKSVERDSMQEECMQKEVKPSGATLNLESSENKPVINEAEVKEVEQVKPSDSLEPHIKSKVMSEGDQPKDEVIVASPDEIKTGQPKCIEKDSVQEECEKKEVKLLETSVISEPSETKPTINTETKGPNQIEQEKSPKSLEPYIKSVMEEVQVQDEVIETKLDNIKTEVETNIERYSAQEECIKQETKLSETSEGKAAINKVEEEAKQIEQKEPSDSLELQTDTKAIPPKDQNIKPQPDITTDSQQNISSEVSSSSKTFSRDSVVDKTESEGNLVSHKNTDEPKKSKVNESLKESQQSNSTPEAFWDECDLENEVKICGRVCSGVGWPWYN